MFTIFESPLIAVFGEFSLQLAQCLLNVAFNSDLNHEESSIPLFPGPTGTKKAGQPGKSP